MSMAEAWLPVVGWEGYYEVSDRGQIRTVARIAMRRNGSPVPVLARLLKTFRTPPMGYHAVKLSRGGKETRESIRVHNAVLQAFVGPRPRGLVALHRDDDVDNNCLSNLEWGTQQKNLRDAVARGRHPEANKTHCKRRHEFTPENTYINPTSGARQCRTCVRDLNRRIEQAKRVS